VGNSRGAKYEFDNRYMYSKQISIIGSTMGTIADYERVMGLVFNGRLQPIIDSVTPLSEGLNALKRLQENDVIGKLILQP
jgi:D-arabinose 1-dehydrogenase-like Zn-dependent alcohol dehydrogenase